MNESTQVEEQISVQVKPSEAKVSYKTKLIFIDKDRGKKEHVSVSPPSISQAGILTFLLEDRLLNYPLNVVFYWETERLDAIEPSKIILSEK